MKEKTQKQDPQLFPPELLERAMVDLEIRLHNVPWDGKVAFCVVGRTVAPNDARRYAMVTSMILEPVAEGDLLKPTFQLRRDQVQALMDELYRIGFRPSEEGTAGELAATK